MNVQYLVHTGGDPSVVAVILSAAKNLGYAVWNRLVSGGRDASSLALLSMTNHLGIYATLHS
jgi:hypothetical protein